MFPFFPETQLSVTNQTHKNGDASPYPSQQQPNEAMSYMHHGVGHSIYWLTIED